MRDTQRLTFISDMSNHALNELWVNCFSGQENLNHMNAHVPFSVTQQWQLNGFLTNQNGYNAWLIKRNAEQDIIGFAIHGNFFQGLPNNIGFNIGLNYTRNGYASETLQSLVEHLKEIELKETFGHCFETNLASIRTMEKCGFINMGRTGRQFKGNYELKFKRTTTSLLDIITKQQIEFGEFPLQELLKDSFYYPSCGFDGGIVRDCNTIGRELKIVSFIYCDYATGEQAFREEHNTFLGYSILGSRSVKHSELTPNGWFPQFPRNFNLQYYQRYKDTWQPFINWTVYERNENRGDEHGPKRFSLLYLGGEGVATYQALFWSNKTWPKALAIIQPGTGFGLNWTDFRDRNGALAWVVNNNPAGQPETIYYGGYGQGYDDFEWDNYTEQRIINPYYHKDRGEVRIWQKQNPS